MKCQAFSLNVKLHQHIHDPFAASSNLIWFFSSKQACVITCGFTCPEPALVQVPWNIVKKWIIRNAKNNWCSGSFCNTYYVSYISTIKKYQNLKCRVCHGSSLQSPVVMQDTGLYQ